MLSNTPNSGARRSRHPTLLVILSGLVLGTVDLLFAYGFWRSAGASLVGILHSIASGVYGKESATFGMTSALVGLVCHYGIAIAMVAVCVFIWKRFKALPRHWIAAGLAYGLGLYLVMNFIVVPLSAAAPPRFTNIPWVASSIAMHMLFGVLCSWTARRIQSARSD
jgi:uncharacterized membrane protein YagU involved in acid resistance